MKKIRCALEVKYPNTLAVTNELRSQQSVYFDNQNGSGKYARRRGGVQGARRKNHVSNTVEVSVDRQQHDDCEENDNSSCNEDDDDDDLLMESSSDETGDLRTNLNSYFQCQIIGEPEGKMLPQTQMTMVYQLKGGPIDKLRARCVVGLPKLDVQAGVFEFTDNDGTIQKPVEVETYTVML